MLQTNPTSTTLLETKFILFSFFHRAQNTEFWITYPNGSSSAIRDLRHGKQHQIPTATEQFGRLRQDQVTSVGPTFLNGRK